MPTPPSASSDLWTEVAQHVPGVRADDWRPPVQGAVGHVLGASDADGHRYVIKLHADEAPRLAEAGALAELVDEPLCPRLIATARGWLLMTRRDGDTVAWCNTRM